MEDPIQAYNEYQQNKYIYFNQSHPNASKGTTILVNPHFRDNTKVFVNPNFPNGAFRPNIHVNPNVINMSTPNTVVNTKLTSNSFNHHILKNISTDDTRRVVVSTKNKLVKLPDMNKYLKGFEMPSRRNKPTNPLTTINLSKTVSNPYKKINVHKEDVVNRIKRISRMSVINIPKKHEKIGKDTSLRNLSRSRFKFIKNNTMLRKVERKILVSKHKIVNFSHTNPQQELIKIKPTAKHPHMRRKYVYVNKYNSSSFLANNVIFKNTNRRSLIKINGMFYKNSPSVLKKTNIILNADKNLRNESCKSRLSLNESFKQYGSRKLIRRRVASISKLKKNNVPCAVYKRFGKCNGQKKGTCIKIHNPDQIVLCPKFLLGACIKRNCLLSHKISPEKMPTCKYFLEGLCSRDDCQYLHVKINPNADICKDFLAGFCQKGNECNNRHQFLCPEFEKTKKCSKRRCEYPHIHIRSTLNRTRKPSTKRRIMRKTEKLMIQTSMDKVSVRYYAEASDETTPEEMLISKRPKLGSLPSFIPLSGNHTNELLKSPKYSSGAGI